MLGCQSQAGEAAFQCRQMHLRNGRACSNIQYDPVMTLFTEIVLVLDLLTVVGYVYCFCNVSLSPFMLVLFSIVYLYQKDHP